MMMLATFIFSALLCISRATPSRTPTRQQHSQQQREVASTGLNTANDLTANRATGLPDKHCQDRCNFDEWGNIAFEKLDEFQQGALSKSREMQVELMKDKQQISFEFQLEVASCVGSKAGSKDQIQVSIHKANDPQTQLGRLKACDESNEIVSTRSMRLGHFSQPSIELDDVMFSSNTAFTGAATARVRGRFKYKDDNDAFTQRKLEYLFHSGKDKILFCVRVEITNCNNFLILSKEKLVEVELQKRDHETFAVTGEALIAYKNFRDKIFEVVPDGVEQTTDFHIFPCEQQMRFGNSGHQIGETCYTHRRTNLQPNSRFTLCIVSREKNWISDYEMKTISFTIPPTCQVCDQRSAACLAATPAQDETFLIWPNRFWDNGFFNNDISVTEEAAPATSRCMLYGNEQFEGYLLNARLHERFFLDCQLQFSGTVQVKNSVKTS